MSSAWGVAAVGAVANLAGGVGSVVTDGWDYNPFAPGAAESPPWYAFVIGISAFIFAFGSILTGEAEGGPLILGDWKSTARPSWSLRHCVSPVVTSLWALSGGRRRCVQESGVLRRSE